MKKFLSILLALTLCLSLAACGEKAVEAPDPKTCSYDDMVAYLTSKGFIAEGTTPVDINTTPGYVTDNTGGEMPFSTVADKAEDWGGLWLFWFDGANQSECYTNNFANIAANSGMIVVMGGANILQTAGYNGYFAIAFAEDYAQKDAALEAFTALTSK